MTSTHKARNVIFDFERPETPTEIRSTFAVEENANANIPSPMGEDGRESPMLHGDNAQDMAMQTENRNPTQNSHEPQKLKNFFISEDEDLTTAEQLSLAEERIIELESKLEIVERELRLSQERAKKLASQGHRLRRLARSGDLFRRNQTSSDNLIDVVDKEGPVGEYISLTISEISSKEVSHGSEEPSAVGIPLYLRRFEGQSYVIGPKGVTIGSGNYCGIWIPEEADIKDNHAVISWDEATKTFHLSNGRSANADLVVTFIPVVGDSPVKNLTEFGGFPLLNQLKFKTGLIEWTVSPVPQRKLIISRLFEALRNRNLAELQEQWLFAESWNNYLKKLSIDRATKSLFLIDSNVDEDIDYRIIDEQAKRTPKFSEEVTDAPSVHDSHFGSAGDRPGKFCLLHIAVDYLFVEGARFLLEKGAEVNKRCGNAKFSPLHMAVKRGSLDITQLLLYYGADLELTDSGHLTAVALAGTYQLRKILLSSLMLCAAAEGGDFQEVQRLIESGTSPNGKALCHKAPLHLASLNGNVKVVEYLLEKGAFINMTGGRRNRTALHYASAANNVAIVKVLLKFNADQEVVDATGYTALNLSNGGEVCRLLHKNPLSLCLASQAGDVEEVRRILEENASRKASANDSFSRRLSKTLSGRKISHNISNFGRCLAVDQRNEQGHAPLHLASAAGNLELVQLLVSYGATVDMAGGLDKWTALFYAALAGHVEVVGFLLAIGADTSRADAKGLTVVDHVEQNIDDLKEKLDQKSFRENSYDTESLTQLSQSLSVPAQLLRQRSDSSLDSKGQRSWMKKQIIRLEHVLNILQSGQQKLLNALEQQNLHLFKHTLENEDVKINEPLSKHSQTTALLYASANGMPDFVRVLLQHHADTNICDSHFLYPIHAAAKAGHEDIVGILVDHGVDINLQMRYSCHTPLHVAAMHTRKEVVELLIDKGADLDALDIERHTPFDVADEIEIKSLIASGCNLIFIALANGDMNTLLKSIEQGKNIAPTVFSSGASALQVACQYERLEVVEMLLNQGADVNYQGGPTLSSPLHLAVLQNSLALAKLLVENGGKLSATNAEGKTPFEIATSNAMRKVLVDARPIKSVVITKHNSTNADDSEDEDRVRKNLCRICFDEPANTIVLPCGHQAFCKNCASQLEVCAFDRRPISQVVPVFRLTDE